VTALAALDRWPDGPRAVAVLVADEVVDDRGDTTTALPWASVTKLATALAALVAVADGRVSLDDPAGPAGSTVAHLLAHASGLDFDTGAVRAPPGTRRIYSNAGYETLAGHVADRVGQPFARWLDRSVLEPLAMAATRLEGSPASGLVGPVADLAALTAELAAPTLVPAESAALLRTVAFPGLAGLLPGVGWQARNDWGLGPEVRDGKSPHWTGTRNSASTFGHFGAAGGFCWVDPASGVACACLTATAFGPWALERWPELSDDVLAAYGRPWSPEDVTPPA